MVIPLSGTTLTSFLPTVKAMVRIVAALILAAALTAAGDGQAPSSGAAPGIAYICPMHPDVVSRSAGTCARCGMTLNPADPFDAREFVVDVAARFRRPASTAAAAQPGAAGAALTLTVREPETRTVVRDFFEVHEKRYHLFVVSHDLDHYDHVHPEQRADGSFAIDVRFPKPGLYRVYSDFFPVGGVAQVIPATIATPGFTGSVASQRARLVPDETLTKTVGGMRVTLGLPADGLVAGRDEALKYRVVDVASGAPIRDLEVYLAAFGHTLLLSEDTLHYVHAHPVEAPEGVAGGGPDLTFKALMPKPGRYKLWTQLKRKGVVSTVSFTVAVASPVR